MRQANHSEVALKSFEHFLPQLATIPDPRRAEGKLYQLPHVLLFSIFAIVSGANSYRGIPGALTSMLTTTTLYRSSLEWFGACS